MIKREIFVIKEIDCNALAICLKPSSSRFITIKMLDEIRAIQGCVVDDFLSKKWQDFFLLVWYLDKRKSSASLGLDYSYIYSCLKGHKEALLEKYIDRIFDVLFLNHINLGLPLINCSIINRRVSGILREFFLLNSINFIHKESRIDLEKFTVNEFKNLAFPLSIYLNNHYFYFGAFKPEKMRDAISEINAPLQEKASIQKKQQEFVKIRDETLARIYSVAAKNLRVIQRLVG